MMSAPFAEPLRQGYSGASSALGRSERWLDDHGKGAWIVAMILGFVLFWPIGLAILAYMIWSKRMFGRSSSCGSWGRHGHHHHHHQSREDWEAMKDTWRNMGQTMRPTGNAAFDSYKAETIRRLQEEQQAFEAFLQRLREAKDKSEFDAFMEDRAKAARAGDVPPEPPQAAA